MMATTTTKGEETPSSSSTPALEQPCHIFTLADILSATRNFAEELCIGRGGFGKVYKGVIKDGTMCAIKRLHSFSNQGAPEFWAEVKMLSRLRHCNLVSLIGYCNDGPEMVLVYDYMPNGTLEDCLHKNGTALTWLQLLKICIGTARGLDYLHMGTGTQHGVIHRDVKSSNILLDENYAAKVSDFGLAKITQINQTLTHISTVVKGTFGYMDPSYFYSGKLTRKSDVYAFGVILLEVLCRRPAVDSSLDEGLAIWAQDRIKQGKLNQIINSRLREQISTNSLKEFSRIAFRCLLSRPNQRPTMGEIIASLELTLSLQERRDSSRRVNIDKMWSFFSLRGRSKFMLPIPTHAMGREGTHGDEAIKVEDDYVDPEPAMLPIPTHAMGREGTHGDEAIKVEDDYVDPEPAIEGLEIIGNAFPGEKLLACGYSINGTSRCMFQWVRHLADGMFQYIEGATDPTYTVISNDVGSYLAVEVVPMNDNGRQGQLVECFFNDKKRITTAIISEVVEDDYVDPGPGIMGLEIIGNAFLGEKLQACGYSINGTSHCVFQWVRHLSDGTYQLIEGANHPTYTVTSEDVGSYLAVEVLPKDDNGRLGKLVECSVKDKKKITTAIISEVVEDDDVDPEPGLEGLMIIGNAFLGEKLLACGYPINGTANCIFRWVHYLSDGTFQYIEGATEPTYTVTSDDVGSYLAVQAIPMDDNGRKGKLVKCFVNDKKRITTAIISEVSP